MAIGCLKANDKQSKNYLENIDTTGFPETFVDIFDIGFSQGIKTKVFSALAESNFLKLWGGASEDKQKNRNKTVLTFFVI